MIMLTTEKILNFTAAVRDFHYYQKIWSPKEGEVLSCYHERDNAFDVFALKTESKNSSTVGHLPREVSRITKFILDRGAKVTARLTSTNFRRSPMIQGSLEIACEVTVKMPATIKNRSSRPEVFFEKAVLRNFAKFTGKHLRQSLFNKVAGLQMFQPGRREKWEISQLGDLGGAVRPPMGFGAEPRKFSILGCLRG